MSSNKRKKQKKQKKNNLVTRKLNQNKEQNIKIKVLCGKCQQSSDDSKKNWLKIIAKLKTTQNIN